MPHKNEHFQMPALDASDLKEGSTYTNPVFRDFPDPCVTYCPETGYYYACRSHFDPFGVDVCRGRTLLELFDEERVVFETGNNTGLYKGVWASEMHRIGDRWYIYAAASCHETEEWPEKRMRTFVLASRTKDPFDGFDYAGILMDDAAIDATVFQDKKHGKNYLVYSRCLDVDRQSLVIWELATPTQLCGKPERIARAVYPWELVPPFDGEKRINEGPFFITRGDRTFCIYSANACWQDEYCLGVLELVGNDPMNISSWVKDDVPLLKMGNGVYAPGHASFFTSPDGTETYVAYHCVPRPNPEVEPTSRHLCVQKVLFDETGFPHIGEPIPLGTRLPLPSGDPGLHKGEKA